MNPSQILSQAISHVPALFLIWLGMWLTYWLLGIAKWPKVAWRNKMLDKWGFFEIDSLGGFRFSSLALISLVSLFLELFLIRWVTSEIRVFAYFKSLVLIACFLGFGLGCYLTRKRINLAYTYLPLLCMVLFTELPWEPVRRLITNLSAFIGWFSDVHIWNRVYFTGNFFWGAASGGIAISIIIPLFGLIALTMVPFGQLVGWYLENSTKGILAYSVNVLASIVGIWLFTALCFLSTPPVIWFIFLGLGILVYFRKIAKLKLALLVIIALIIVLFGIGTQKRQWWGEESWKGSTPQEHQLESGKVDTFWSPYQKLTLVPLKRGNEIVRYILKTNDTWYQQILDLSNVGITRYPDLYALHPPRYNQYDIGYQFYKNPPQVLILGAGMGNDAAAALRNGAKHITAVEIDPLIYKKGKKLHFEHPYSSSRVEVHVDDARSFIQNTKEKFDLVVFSLLDSHTTSSHYTNIRLDNFVYTVEAMEATRKLLKPDGLMVMSFSAERPWFTKRLRDVIVRAFGREPLTIHTGMSYFIIGLDNRVQTALEADKELRQFVSTHSNIPLEEAELTTDDWPYLYLQHRGIPIITWLLSIGLIGVCWITMKTLVQSSKRIEWHFFFLGAAFMLLEVQIISKAALLFGTTWLVNSIVITTLLLFILLANSFISLFPKFPIRLAYLGLFITLGLGYLIPTNFLFYESLLIRITVSMVLYCSPAFFAGLVFISSFKRIGFRAEAFGSNLLGSLVGGLLESLSYLTGIKALVIIAAFLYLLSLMTINRIRTGVSLNSTIGDFLNKCSKLRM
jgi:hypothetical protein